MEGKSNIAERTETFKNWCIEQHTNTNHFYGEGSYIPYRFHLEMVIKEVYNHIGDNDIQCISNGITVTNAELIMSAAGHDLIEDTRNTFNDVLKACGHKQVANIIYAVTNEKGRNRAERGNAKYYEGIRNTAGASFIKFCDRIANVKYSKLVGSSMFEMYRKENAGFVEKCYTEDLAPYKLKETLLSLFD